MFFSLILMMAITIISVYFALENTEIAKATFFGFPVEGSIGVILLVTLGIGTLLGIFVMLPSMISRGITIARLRRRVNELERYSPSQEEPFEIKD
ncbi:MAG: hypothetical protein A2Y54_08275 [Chloroflexi bacterium RBG_16_51_16]|nr:MAG: hypothetical protein A2Y54_08275 [Chloroflexi bacterium RBG_16_51_16]